MREQIIHRRNNMEYKVIITSDKTENEYLKNYPDCEIYLVIENNTTGEVYVKGFNGQGKEKRLRKYMSWILSKEE